MNGGIYGGGDSDVAAVYTHALFTVSLIPFAIPHLGHRKSRSRPDPLSSQFDGLLHRWDCASVGAGGRKVYESNKGLHGSIVGLDPEDNWQPDGFHTGHVFSNNGGTDYIDISGSSGVLNGASQATFSAWVYMNSLTAQISFLSKNDSVMPTLSGFRLSWSNSTGFTVHVYNPSGSGKDRVYTNPAGFLTGVWYHITVVYNGALATNLDKVKIYVNGANKSASSGGTIPTAIAANATNVQIGAWGTQRWNGRLADIRIYNRALTAGEAGKLFLPQATLDTETMVVAQADVPVAEGTIASGQSDIYGTQTGITTGVGTRAAGSALVSHVFANFDGSGGVYGAGQAFSQVVFIPTGGILGDGAGVISISFVMQGGVVASGTPSITGVTNEPPNGILVGKALAGGSANSNDLRRYTYGAFGTAFVAGNSKCAIKNVKFSARGGVVMSGDTGATIPRFVFNKDVTFLWDVRTVIEKLMTFLWNVGRLQMFWYRVVSKGLDGNGCPLEGNPCCQKFIVNVHARTIAELCSKLSKRKFKFPIESVQKFSRPAENAASDALEDAGIPQTCQELIPVEICSVPACADFCVDQDLKAPQIGFRIRVQVNSFFFAEGSGEGFYGGSAITTYHRNVPDFPYTMSGGPVTSGGDDYQTSSYRMRGGAVMAGTAHVESSAYRYVGGVWPNVRGKLFGTVATTTPTTPTDQVWALPERVNADDSLFSQSDISFGKSSQVLMATNLRLDIPSWASILGLYVRIGRLATQSGIRDLEVYLTKNGKQISDNLALTNIDWPLIETERLYGSDGISPGTSWRNPDGDDYVGPLTFADLNDPTFGVAIRVKSRFSLPTTIAKINYINVEAFYEDANGSIVRVSGEARTRDHNYHYKASGKQVVKSLARIKQGFKYKTTGLGANGFGEVSPSGHATIGFYHDTAQGGMCGGEAKVTPYIEEGVGGAVSGGDAKVTPYFEYPEGGLIAGGKALRSNEIHYVGDGVITVAGTSYTPETRLYFTASGGPVLGSNFRIRSNIWKFVSDGNVAFIFGSAGQKASDIGTPIQSVGFGMMILQTTATFLTDVDKQDAGILTGNVFKCGCEGIPFTLELTHNIARDNLFAKYLVRNNFTVPRVLKMRYNIPNDSWQCNLHYRGQSAETTNPESWDLTFELQCTDVMGGIGIGVSIWKLAIQIFRKNLMTREAFESRVIVGILPEGTCGATGNQLDFDITYDTQVGNATVKPRATVYQNTIFDNIGLFRNRAWIEAPDLALKVSQGSVPPPQPRVDLTDAVLID